MRPRRPLLSLLVVLPGAVVPSVHASLPAEPGFLVEALPPDVQYEGETRRLAPGNGSATVRFQFRVEAAGPACGHRSMVLHYALVLDEAKDLDVRLDVGQQRLDADPFAASSTSSGGVRTSVLVKVRQAAATERGDLRIVGLRAEVRGEPGPLGLCRPGPTAGVLSQAMVVVTGALDGSALEPPVAPQERPTDWPVEATPAPGWLAAVALLALPLWRRGRRFQPWVLATAFVMLASLAAAQPGAPRPWTIEPAGPAWTPQRPFEGRWMPGVDLARIEFPFRVVADALRCPAPATVSVVYDVVREPAAQVLVALASNRSIAHVAPQEAASVRAVAWAALKPDAPAFADQNIVLRATVQPAGNGAGQGCLSNATSDPAIARFPMTADFRPELRAAAARAVGDVRPWLRLANFGNGDTRAEVFFGEEDGWVPATETILESKVWRGPAAAGHQDLRLPSPPPHWDGQLRILGSSATPVSRGAAVEVLLRV